MRARNERTVAKRKRPLPASAQRSVALWRAIRVETACAVCLIDSCISMHLATKILLVRFTQRFSAQIFRGTSFFGTFPARNMKASSTLSVNSYRLALLVRSEHYDLC